MTGVAVKSTAVSSATAQWKQRCGRSFKCKVQNPQSSRQRSSRGLLKARGAQFQICRNWQKKRHSQQLSNTLRRRETVPRVTSKPPPDPGQKNDFSICPSDSQPGPRSGCPVALGRNGSDGQRAVVLDKDYTRKGTPSLIKLELKSYLAKCLRVLVFVTSKKLTCVSAVSLEGEKHGRRTELAALPRQLFL